MIPRPKTEGYPAIVVQLAEHSVDDLLRIALWIIDCLPLPMVEKISDASYKRERVAWESWWRVVIHSPLLVRV